MTETERRIKTLEQAAKHYLTRYQSISDQSAAIGSEDEITDIKKFLIQVETLLESARDLAKCPNHRLVMVHKSRKVAVGSVGRVVYADAGRDRARVEFGPERRVHWVRISQLEIIDWKPLPDFVPVLAFECEFNYS